MQYYRTITPSLFYTHILDRLNTVEKCNHFIYILKIFTDHSFQLQTELSSLNLSHLHYMQVLDRNIQDYVQYVRDIERKKELLKPRNT